MIQIDRVVVFIVGEGDVSFLLIKFEVHIGPVHEFHHRASHLAGSFDFLDARRILFFYELQEFGQRLLPLKIAISDPFDVSI